MAHLAIHLFGALQVECDDTLVTRYGSAKTQALLAYLVTEADRPHRRESLAELLWPERPQHTAQTNLRQALSMLRKAVGDRGVRPGCEPLLRVGREALRFNRACDCWVDIHAFERLLAGGGAEGPAADALSQAVALYRGDFLEGFYISDSPAFDDWALIVRNRLQRQATTALRYLIEAHMALGQIQEACTHAWRWVELEPWQETAHQQLMVALALSGLRTEAMAQFEACRRMLQQEYGVEPAPETVRLWQQIRDGWLAPRTRAVLVGQAAGPSADPLSGFVGREHELAALEGHLAAALADHGRITFVAGEAGQGKTALVHAFARRAQRRHPHLLVAEGNCNAYTGVGDPYLPFREILELLTGDTEGKAASLAPGWARNLRQALPLVARALTEHGPDLIDVFVPGQALLRRATAGAGPGEHWVAALGEVVARQAGEQQPRVRQEDLFEQVTRVLSTVARQAPLLLVIDDLQWADPGTIGLLFHLGRRLSGSPILIVGAYRVEEVAAGRDGVRHPLEAVLGEFRRTWGDSVLDLRDADAQQFVAALLDREPNALDDGFRQTLVRQTGGQALFAVELLRGMQERGDLVRDAGGRWIAGPRLAWEVLPARVEAVIAERVGRLAAPLRAVLEAASVEGEVFTAEVVAEARNQPVQAVIDRLSGELDRKHHLVRAVGVQSVDGQRLSQYRFRHILFQTYVYNSLDEIERVHLHAHVGAVLEALYRSSDVALAAGAPLLARQFERAGNADKAARFYGLAGQRAIRMLAYQEAIAHLTRGIDLLKQLPSSAQRDERELALRLAVAMPIFVLKSWGADELVDHYRRAEVLAERLGDVARQLQFLSLSVSYTTVRAEFRQSLQLAERYAYLAQQLEDQGRIVLGHQMLAALRMFLGDFEQCEYHSEQALALYDPREHSYLRFEYGTDPEVVTLVCRLYSLWYMGYPDQALDVAREAVATGEALAHPLSLCLALAFEARLHRWRGELDAVDALTPRQRATATEYDMPLAEVAALQDQAWVTSERGDPEGGIARMNQALAFWDATGMANHLTEFYGVLAEMYGKAGQPAEGLAWIDKALAVMDRTGEHYHDAELYRLRGELRLQSERHAPEAVLAAEADFDRATEVSRHQEAKSLELRAAMSRYRLRRYHGTPAEAEAARQALAEVYAWFTEGFGTRDLREANALLAEWSGPAAGN